MPATSAARSATCRPWAVDVSSGVEELDAQRRAAPGNQGSGADPRLSCKEYAVQMAELSRLPDLPDERGHFGPYGGIFVAETLMHALDELKAAYARYRDDPEFVAEFERELKHYVGRPIARLPRRSAGREQLGGAQIYLKREDLNHTGAHKINNMHRPGAARASAWASRASSPRPAPASTASRPPRSARATAWNASSTWASEDVKRQAQNVYRMNLLGATVVPVESGSKTLKDALNEAMRDWVTNVENTFYIIGTVAGPHPYPMMVRDFQSVIGDECLAQMPEMAGRQPDAVIACVGGGCNAMGIFYPYIAARGRAADRRRGGRRGHRDAAGMRRRCPPARPACCTATAPTCCRTRTARSSRRIRSRPASIIPGVGPEHAWLKDTGRAEYVVDHRRRGARGVPRAAAASKASSRRSNRAMRSRYAMKLAPTHAAATSILLVNLSGRGDKDMHTVAERSGAILALVRLA